MNVCVASDADLAAVMNVLDGAAMEISAETVRAAIDRDRVLVARSAAGTVLGAIVGGERDHLVRILAIAVRPGRRGDGIGSALIQAAHDRWGPLEAEFDPDLAPFYRNSGFAIEPDDRYRGRLGAPDRSVD
jgi:GNAT superfamily N-acetyltransferase